MKFYLVVYKLSLPESNYPEVIKFLKTAIRWAKLMDSVWIIETSAGSAEIRDGIKKRTSSSDSILVIEVPNHNWATYNISKKVTDWMKGLSKDL